LKEQILLLIKLQDIDSEIKRLTARKGALPEEKERLEEEREHFEKGIEEDKEQRDTLNQAHSDKEKELRGNIESAKKTKNRLLEVKTNKEYEAMLKEIENINKKNSSIEDEIINLLEEVEKAGTNLKEREAERVEYIKSNERDITRIDEEMDSIDSLLKKMLAEDATCREIIKPDLLKRYDVIKEKRNGQAVVPVWKEVCGGCHMNIPPQLYIELQKYEKVMLCPNCNRIIYWEDRDNNDQG
jgi:predicted  nucleic acid-binding Zn-ribbon protein